MHKVRILHAPENEGDPVPLYDLNTTDQNVVDMHM